MEENVTDVIKILDKDRRVTYLQIEGILGLNAPVICSISKDHLHMKKLCYLWVPNLRPENSTSEKLPVVLKMFNKRHNCTTTICRSSLETKFVFLKMRTHPKLSENHDQNDSCIFQIE